jgi:hypothetical protein
MMRSATAVACSTCVALLLTITGVARAETVSVDTSSITRINPDNSPAPLRLVEGAFQGVGFTDCMGNTSFVFNVAIGDFSSTTPTTYDLEVWVGTGDCTQPDATHDGSGSCWPVIASMVPSTPVPITIRVQDLVSNVGISPPAQTYTAATVNACSTAQNALSTSSTTTTDDAGNPITVSGQATLNVFFMLFPIGGAIMPAAASPAYPIIVDFTTPDPATTVTALPGSTELAVSWIASPDSDIAGYNVYSAPAAGAADAGCDNLINTSTATLTVVTGATNTTLLGLANGTSYDVAVTAFDSFGNVSALSNIACNSPSAINDFWTIYNQSGGTASSCTLGTNGAPAAGILAAMGGLVFLHRRKSKRQVDR